MKKIILFGMLCMSGMLFSCSNEDEQDLSMYVTDSTLYGTGGEEGQTPPPPTEPAVILP